MVNEAWMRAYEQGVENGLDRIIEGIRTEATQIIVTEAFDEGTLARSTETASPSRFERVIRWTAEHAAPVHDGSRPHWPPFQPIFEWVGRKLGLTGQEQEEAARGIQAKIAREGTEPVPYAQQAAGKVRPETSRIMREAIESSLRRAGY